MASVKQMTAVTRSRTGKGAARAEGRVGRGPGGGYGDGKPPLNVSVDHADLKQRIYAGRFLTTIYELEVDGTKQRVIPRDFQLDPLQDLPRRTRRGRGLLPKARLRAQHLVRLRPRALRGPPALLLPVPPRRRQRRSLRPRRRNNDTSCHRAHRHPEILRDAGNARCVDLVRDSWMPTGAGMTARTGLHAAPRRAR